MRGGCAERAEQAASVSAKSSQLSPNQTVALFEDGRVGSISSNHLGGDAARDAQKESPGLVTKARSRRRPSFYAATPSFSSSDDAPLSLLKLEAGAAPISPTAGSCYLTTAAADWCAGCGNPKLT